MGKRCRPGIPPGDRIEAILAGVVLLLGSVLLTDTPCLWCKLGTGMRAAIGRCTMGKTVVRDGPCRIMARVSGPAVLALAERGAGTSGRRSR